MNIIVDRPRLVKVVKLYLTKNFGDLTPKTSSKYPDSVFYVDSNNRIFMEQDSDYDFAFFFVSYEDIWLKLESYFPIKPREIQLILKNWLVEHYKLENIIQSKIGWPSSQRWRNVTNLT